MYIYRLLLTDSHCSHLNRLWLVSCHYQQLSMSKPTKSGVMTLSLKKLIRLVMASRAVAQASLVWIWSRIGWARSAMRCLSVGFKPNARLHKLCFFSKSGTTLRGLAWLKWSFVCHKESRELDRNKAVLDSARISDSCEGDIQQDISKSSAG